MNSTRNANVFGHVFLTKFPPILLKFVIVRIVDKNAIGFAFKDRGGLPIGSIRVFCLVFC